MDRNDRISQQLRRGGRRCVQHPQPAALTGPQGSSVTPLLSNWLSRRNHLRSVPRERAILADENRSREPFQASLDASAARMTSLELLGHPLEPSRTRSLHHTSVAHGINSLHDLDRACPS